MASHLRAAVAGRAAVLGAAMVKAAPFLKMLPPLQARGTMKLAKALVASRRPRLARRVGY